jgi:ABC-type multidrug transport system ATPase subunit
VRRGGARSTARGVAALAIVLLAAVSAPRLPLDLAPREGAAELVATLQLPPSASADPVELARRWVVPLETAVRSLGDVIATRGEVGADAATIVVRFRRGTDAELKAARLVSELAPLRAQLPEGALTAVWPSTQSGTRPSAVYALTGAADVERVADALRATPGVREVATFGGTQEEVNIRTIRPLANTAVVEALSPRTIGLAPFGERRAAVIAGASAPRIADVRINGQRLGSIASITTRLAPPQSAARLNGRKAVLVTVVRDDDVSLFAFDRAVRTTLRGLAATALRSDAAELRALLLRVALGALTAAVILALLARRLALYIPLAFAVMINVSVVTGTRLDAGGILAACVAVAGGALLAAMTPRRDAIPFALFLLLPLTATALAGSALTDLLAAPARTFALAALSSTAAALLLPSRAGVTRAGGALTRRALRASPSLILAALASATFLFSWFGARLDPRHRDAAAERGRLYLRLALPAGTPLAPTLTALGGVESALRRVEGIARFWSFAGPSRATIAADVAPSFQRPDQMEMLKLRVQAAMPLGRGLVRIEQAFDGGAASDGELEDRPAADAAGFRYRVLLKGTDAGSIRLAAERITARLAPLGIRRDAVVSEWPQATTRVLLVPHAEVTPAMAETIAQNLAERTLPPRPRTLPDGRLLTVATIDAPHADDDIPRAAALFAVPLPLPVSGAFDIRQEPLSGVLTRELGRFVLPLSIAPGGMLEEQKLASRREMDRMLSTMPLPPGVVLERPALDSWRFTAEKGRLFGLIALLPALLFALAAIVLSSLRRAGIALFPALVAVACIAPLLLLVDARLDEGTLFAAACAVCAVTAVSTLALARFGGAGRTYRTLRALLVPSLGASLAAGVMLMIASTAATQLGDVWRAPLLAAGIVFLAGGAGAMLLPAAFTLPLETRQSALAFAVDGKPLELQVQNVTKVYAPRFRALDRVSFTLGPGIVGLLGPNGAGKTTLLRILTGLLLPTRGVVRFAGQEVRPSTLASYRTHIGFLPQEFNAYAGLTAAQFLDYWALERGVATTAARKSEVERLLAIARLEEHADRKLRDFSGGMRQRIGIARALIGDPRLIVVDEPTTGLDIEARAHFRHLITSLARDRIIILSTHIAGDVESTASRLLLLARGQLRWDGTPEELIRRARGRVFETIAGDAEARELTRSTRITTRVRVAGGLRLRGLVAPGEALPGPAAEPTLEEAYLAEVAPPGAQRRGSFAFVFERA